MDELFKKLKRPFNGTWDAVEADMAVFEFILFRLSIRNVLKFKSVSKLWHSILSTKYFIIMQRLWSKRHPKYFVFYDAGDLEDEIVREMRQMEPNGDYIESYSIPEFETIHSPLIISSFNGLICCLNNVNLCKNSYEVDIRICNPSTREVLLLPRSHPSVYQPIFGVIYANKFHFYKIFKFFSDPIDIKEGNGNNECEVYSSNTGLWKRLGKVQIRPMMGALRPLIPNHVCVNEKLYWLIADKNDVDFPGSVLVVDMNEKFQEIQLPMEAEVSFLIEFQSRVCFIDWNGLNISIWIYDEQNDRWHLLGNPMFPDDLLKVEYFDSVVAIEQEILFVYKDVSGFRHEIVYDVQNRIWDYFYIDEDDKDKTLAIFPFTETLIPCNPNFLLA